MKKIDEIDMQKLDKEDEEEIRKHLFRFRFLYKRNGGLEVSLKNL